jgi:hypothetical protein
LVNEQRSCSCRWRRSKLLQLHKLDAPVFHLSTLTDRFPHCSCSVKLIGELTTAHRLSGRNKPPIAFRRFDDARGLETILGCTGIGLVRLEAVLRPQEHGRRGRVHQKDLL